MVLPVFMRDKASERCRPVPDLPKLQNSKVEELPKLLLLLLLLVMRRWYRATGALELTLQLGNSPV